MWKPLKCQTSNNKKSYISIHSQITGTCMSCLIIGVLKSTSKIKVHQFLYIFGIHCLEKEGPMYRLVTYVEA